MTIQIRPTGFLEKSITISDDETIKTLRKAIEEMKGVKIVGTTLIKDGIIFTVLI